MGSAVKLESHQSAGRGVRQVAKPLAKGVERCSGPGVGMGTACRDP